MDELFKMKLAGLNYFLHVATLLTAQVPPSISQVLFYREWDWKLCVMKQVSAAS